MNKKIIAVTFLVTFLYFSPSFATDETLTITTYYPSPYGAYRELKSARAWFGRDSSGDLLKDGDESIEHNDTTAVQIGGIYNKHNYGGDEVAPDVALFVRSRDNASNSNNPNPPNAIMGISTKGHAIRGMVTSWANPNNMIGAIVGDNAWGSMRPAGFLGVTLSNGASDYFAAMGAVAKVFQIPDLDARLATWSRNFPVPGVPTIFNDSYIAVYGNVPNPCPTGGQCWAGFFNGDVNITRNANINGNIAIGEITETINTETKLDIYGEARIRGSRLQLTGYDGANNFWLLDGPSDLASSPIIVPGGPYTINGRTAIRIGYANDSDRNKGNEKRQITLMGDVEIGTEQNNGINTGYDAFKKNLLVTQDLGIGWGSKSELRSNKTIGGYDLVVYHDGVWGKAAAASFTNSSDINLKEKVASLEGSLDKIMQLRGVSFFWKNTDSGKDKQMGLIAQEVENVYPSLVNGTDGNKTLNYNGLIAPLIEAVKEQQKQIDRLRSEIDSLKEKLTKDNPC